MSYTPSWDRRKCLLIILLSIITSALGKSSLNFKISKKHCKVSDLDGTCMFVWECINTDGRHLGMCMDGFMFGSCCAHNLSDNFVLPQSTPFRPPSKAPTTTKKYRPHKPNQPNRHGTLTIQRPNGGGTLVIRQPQKPQSYYRPTSRTTTTARIPIENLINIDNDLESSASIAAASWSSSPWQMSTEPNFVTKDKTTPIRNKPKPTKKPIIYTGSSIESHTRKPIKFKPKPTAKPNRPYQSSDRTTILQQLPTASPISSNEVVSTERLPLITAEPGRFTLSASRSTECGIPTYSARPETRIVGGKSTPFGKWPWQVSVRRTSFFGFSSTHRCGGAVINENWIATAGHCVDDLLTSQIRIRVGEYDFSHVQEQLPYTERAVAKKVVHPKYNFFTYEFDLALVKLDQPLEFAPHIRPVCLPATEDLLVGMNATVTGWGRLSEGGTLPSVLQEVTVPIVSNERCKSMFFRAGRHEFIPDIFLCAGHDTGGMDSCQGDSGGPLQVKSPDGHYFLAGIISWGIGCAEANLPGVCTRISKFTPWILENVSY